MNTKLINTAADVICRAQAKGKRTSAGLAVALDAAQLLQSPETAAAVRAAALNEGADAVEEMQNDRDDEVNDLLGGLPDRVAVEHATARKAAALLRRMAAAGQFPAPKRADEAVRAAHFGEAARLLEDTGHDDDAMNLLDNVADGIASYAPQSETAPGTCGRALSTGQPCPDHPRVPTENDRLRARVAELEGELAKYVGAEPTIADEMAYLSACLDAVAALELPESLRTTDGSIAPEFRCGYEQALADVRAALEAPERASYPPALPWAALMDHEDLADFLDELAASAITHASAEMALGEVEETCGRWRLIAEAQHAHNTAPGPDAETGGAS